MKRISKNKMEKKDFSAPWALGLGATRRAAMLLVMLLVMLLTMAQTAWAADQTVTYRLITGTKGVIKANIDGNVQDIIVPIGTDIMINSSGQVSNNSTTHETEDVQIKTSHINGKIKQVEFTNIRRGLSTAFGDTYFMGIDGMKYGNADAVTETSEEGSVTFTSATGVLSTNNLTIKLGAESNFKPNSGCDLVITYEPSAAPVHAHNFSFNAVGNTLTATCGHSDGLDCSLADANYQVTLTLTPPVDTYYRPNSTYSATLNLTAFNALTGLNATTTDITYVNNTTGSNLGSTAPTTAGNYTASVTATIGGTNYTLTTSFHIYRFWNINNIYPQFNISNDEYASTTTGVEGQTVTITFTPKFGETLTGVTVTGATTNMSIGSGITSIGNNKYTFTMPAEEVNIGATFSISEDDFAETGTNEYTIKTANGWGWFCFATNYDLAPDGFSGKVVKLAGNVSSSEMAGKSGHPFKGTFDGQNHTLTFNRTAAEHLSAPFHYINGATISNLHVEGTITGGNYESLGGLVGHAEGHITINNCRVSTEISTTVSGGASHGGVIAQWNGTNATCTVTGCVYDGLIYNPDQAGVTTSCRGFIGWDYGNNGTITFTDCLSAPAAYGTGKYALGNNCFTFVYPNSEPTLTYNMTNCYYTSILGNRQGRPAATATVAPANLGNATTDHGMVDGYENGFLYNGNYYTPKYGDAAVEYRFNDWNERADVTLSDRTLYKDGNWNTLCLPFSLSAAQIAANANFAGATLMTMDVTEKNGFDVEDGTLYLWFKTATTIEAGVPYLVKWEKAADYEGNEANYDISNPVFEGVTISNSTAQAVESSTEGLETVQMVGTYSPVSVTANDKSILFLGDANTLYYSTVDRQIRSCRAYFSVPYINGHAEAKARAFALSFDGEETTGILEVSANYNGVTDEAWYSLDGVRLSGKPTQRGLYINNGKKVVIK